MIEKLFRYSLILNATPIKNSDPTRDRKKLRTSETMVNIMVIVLIMIPFFRAAIFLLNPYKLIVWI